MFNHHRRRGREGTFDSGLRFPPDGSSVRSCASKHRRAAEGLEANWSRSSDMSSGGVLRGFVARKLAAASREVLALVDRIVAGYEEEASGFRREIRRQEEQLELLRGEAARYAAGDI